MHNLIFLVEVEYSDMTNAGVFIIPHLGSCCTVLFEALLGTQRLLNCFIKKNE